jgi:hypothetical protein
MGGRALWEGNSDLPRDEVYARYNAVATDGPVAQYRLAVRSALEHIRTRQPWWVFEKAWRQVPGFFAVDSLAVAHVKRGVYGPVGAGTFWLLAAVILAPYVAVVCLFLHGVARLQLGRPQALLLLFLLYYVLVHVAVHGFHRYRLPTLPVLLIFAAALWCGAPRRLPGPVGRVASAVLIVAFLFVAGRDLRDHARYLNPLPEARSTSACRQGFARPPGPERMSGCGLDEPGDCGKENIGQAFDPLRGEVADVDEESRLVERLVREDVDHVLAVGKVDEETVMTRDDRRPGLIGVQREAPGPILHVVVEVPA